MTRSPAVRRSQLLSSPERFFLSNFLAEDRNNELSHRDALAAAQAEHERVREVAIRVYELHELQEEHNRILDAERREQERLRAEAQNAAEEKRLQELRARSIPKPPPRTEPPQPTSPPSRSSPSTTKLTPKSTEEEKKSIPSTTPPSEVKPAATTAKPLLNGIFPTESKPPQGSPFSSAAQKQPQTQPTPLAKPNEAKESSETPAPAAKSQPVSKAQPAKPPSVDRYTQIHQELKKLRRDLQAQSKVAGSPLKGKLGTFRREIRVAIGQLTAGKGANTVPIQKISATLKGSLDGHVQSPLVDASLFVVDAQRQPAAGVPNNDAGLPALFVYLINICAKAIINQFINEAGANSKAADPIGVFTAHIFSHPEFQWRGQSLIDILMAKFRIVCPVLFGYRGDDKTARGRVALGWKRDGSSWITEQSHNDRMTGLGAGFASLSLRDFSKSSKTNPYPPTNYWKALAGIVNTPSGQTSNTQYVVLRSMLQGHEQRFLGFYGNAAIAALRLALVEFPTRASPTATAAGSLQALADLLRTEAGLILT